MRLIFGFNGQEVSSEATHGDKMKVYSVPASYREDGFFIARWRYSHSEPIPACLGSDAAILADIFVQDEQQGGDLYSGFLAPGVEVRKEVVG